MAAPRMKPPTKKKKAPVKKPKVGTVKSPEETRKSISRKQVGTQRPARGGTGGTRAQFLKGPKTPGTSLTVTNRGSLTTPNTRSVAKTGEQVAEKARTAITRTAKNAVGFAEKWIPNALKPKGGGMGLINKAGGVATAVTSIVNPDFMNFKTEKQKEAAKEAGKPSGPLMKGNNMAPTFPKGKGSAAQPKASAGSPFSKGKGSASLPRVSGESLRKAGAGTYTASYDVKTKKSGPSNTAATAAAASSGGGSKSGGSSAAVKKGRSRPQTRTQRDSLAMEQRMSSSGKRKKSMFSLFR